MQASVQQTNSLLLKCFDEKTERKRSHSVEQVNSLSDHESDDHAPKRAKFPSKTGHNNRGIQHSSPPNTLPHAQREKLENAIDTLLTKQVIVPCQHEPCEFVSPIFTIPKKDGSIRLILNLKKLNESVENFHFKMDNIHTVLNLVTRNCWMASLNLKDAYYSVRICPESQKCLKFLYNGQLYRFTVFPNGLSSCPRKFTKLLKPVMEKLRLEGHVYNYCLHRRPVFAGF